MKRTAAVALALLLGSFLPACAHDDAPDATPEPAVQGASAHQYIFHGKGSEAVVERSVSSEGETLRGTTWIETSGFRGLIREEARLAPDGRLLRATVSIADDRASKFSERATFDAAAGLIFVEGRGAGPHGDSAFAGPTRAFRAPNDAPWSYAPVSDARGETISTPITAWVARRAASAANASGAQVRLVFAHAGWSSSVASDQIAVKLDDSATSSTTIVTGNDGADTRGDFLGELRVTGLGLVLHAD
jgi:hypothetical protein